MIWWRWSTDIGFSLQWGPWNCRLKHGILPLNLNNNSLTAEINWSCHVTGTYTSSLVESRIPYMVRIVNLLAYHPPIWGWSFQTYLDPMRKYTQNTVQPVPTRHRRHACIKMQTALSRNTRTWPNVVSILVQRRWWGGGQNWNSIGSNPRVCWAPHRCLSTPTSPLHNIFASRSGYF